MTTPTKEQLAANVDPTVRDYVDACLKEAFESASLVYAAEAESLKSLASATSDRLLAIESFERQVRSHLGKFVPE